MSLREENDNRAAHWGRTPEIVSARNQGRTEEDIAVAFDLFIEKGYDAMLDALRIKRPIYFAEDLLIRSDRIGTARYVRQQLEVHLQHPFEFIENFNSTGVPSLEVLVRGELDLARANYLLPHILPAGVEYTITNGDVVPEAVERIAEYHRAGLINPPIPQVWSDDEEDIDNEE